jgi:hypothetical protein
VGREAAGSGEAVDSEAVGVLEAVAAGSEAAGLEAAAVKVLDRG